MSDNKALWHRAFKTDPDAVKAITGKQYKGNSPKPYWIVERLTEEFGPCGIGWGFTILNERMERLTETDILHVAVMRLWYTLAGVRGEFEQIGQTKAAYKKADGGMMVDEDAPKKSVTDALVKCASYLGFAGDIFSGRWDDSKYVAELRKEFASKADEALQGQLQASIDAEKAKKALQAVSVSPTEGAGKGLSDERIGAMQDLALYMIECHKAGKDLDAIRVYYAADSFSDNDERIYLWSLLKAESKLRSTIKVNRPGNEMAA